MHLIICNIEISMDHEHNLIFLIPSPLLLSIADGAGVDLHHRGDHVPRTHLHPALPEQVDALAGLHHRLHVRRRRQLDPHHGPRQGLREVGAQTDTVG